jgi:hypothetical protein
MVKLAGDSSLHFVSLRMTDICDFGAVEKVLLTAKSAKDYARAQRQYIDIEFFASSA